MTLPSPAQCTATCSGRQRPDLAGKPCRNPPVRGGTVCRMHGGSAPAARARAAERTADAGLRALVAGYEIAPVEDPFTALITLAGEVLGLKDAARGLVADLDSAGEETSLAVYERALDRSAKVLGDVARLKIDDRLARISEQQANTLVQVIAAVVRRLGLDIDDPQVRAAVRTELAAVQP
ncbi:hypothetical protein [Parafrankia discariae]|uniref:hypothetical protein n=1 Tax=Parafrankia discariae TaxID=365528 RepID=UPI0003802E4C|nr:hypothetical protein [Parafrankia discariae]